MVRPADHLHVAKWNVSQVKKAIKIIGQSKNQKAEVYPTS